MKTDTQLMNDVVEELYRTPAITSTGIHVAAHHGVVTLSGSVPHYAEKTAAERATQRVTGVKAIAEELSVDLIGEHIRKDEEIAAAVVHSLNWHVWVPGDVKATVEKGWVTLTGNANWEYERRSTEEALRHLSGVKGIFNNIALMPHVKPIDVKDAIEKRLVSDAEIDAAGVTVTSNDGQVTLTGTVRSWHEREEARVAAWGTPVVSSVHNELVVSQ